MLLLLLLLLLSRDPDNSPPEHFSRSDISALAMTDGVCV